MFFKLKECNIGGVEYKRANVGSKLSSIFIYIRKFIFIRDVILRPQPIDGAVTARGGHDIITNAFDSSWL